MGFDLEQNTTRRVRSDMGRMVGSVWFYVTGLTSSGVSAAIAAYLAEHGDGRTASLTGLGAVLGPIVALSGIVAYRLLTTLKRQRDEARTEARRYKSGYEDLAITTRLRLTLSMSLRQLTHVQVGWKAPDVVYDEHPFGDESTAEKMARGRQILQDWAERLAEPVRAAGFVVEADEILASVPGALETERQIDDGFSAIGHAAYNFCSSVTSEFPFGVRNDEAIQSSRPVPRW